MFDRAAYVAYTATPFANIFVDPDTNDAMYRQDLFPRDFIVSLAAPSNYFGPSDVFGDDRRFLRYVRDHEDLLPLTHKIDHQLSALPGSLQTAVRAFVVACAIRRARGQTRSHTSMLVNASRFVAVQGHIRDEIHDLVSDIRRSVGAYAGLDPEEALRNDEIAALRAVYHTEYRSVSDLPWRQVQGELHRAVSPVQVVEVNGRSPGSLNYAEYPNGQHLIAVGGYSLSRGMTLEGLTVSYFLRRSLMYDTLMQMGRWFGYRVGYRDLCRIWMPESAADWYGHITESIEELRSELRTMAAASATPREFGLRVRSHPDSLIVTARNKIGSGKAVRVLVALGQRLAETTILRTDEETRRANHEAAIALVHRLDGLDLDPEDDGGGRLYRRAPATVVKDFLRAFRVHEAVSHQPGPVLTYIEARECDELSCWDVFFPGRHDRPKRALRDNSLGFWLTARRRSGDDKDKRPNSIKVTSRSRVGSPGDEKRGLEEHVARRAEREWREKQGRQADRKRRPPDRIYRAVRQRPLLIVHLLAIGKEDADLPDSKPHIAWSISFPETKIPEKRVEYIANTTWFRQELELEREEEMAGDDE